MTNYIIDTEVQNTFYNIMGSDDTQLVTSPGSLINPGGIGIESLGDNQQITIDGLVYADLGVDVESDNTSVVVNGNVEGGGVGLQIFGTGDSIDVGSQGTISGGSTGVYGDDRQFRRWQRFNS